MSPSADPQRGSVPATATDPAAPPHRFRNGASLVSIVVLGFASARLGGWLPLWVGGAVLVLGIALLRPRVALVAVLMIIGARAGAAVDSLEPSPSRPVRTEVARLVDDPRPDGVSWRVQLELDGQGVLASARNPQAGALRTASAGDLVRVSGTLRGLSNPTPWTVSNRLVGRMTLTEIDLIEQASGLTGAANAVRDTIRSGAGSLSQDRRVLFTGLVFGDDRGQDVIVADNFRAAGLGHLLAVSGQNVVFVLLLASPVLQRISSMALRFGSSTVVLVGFGFMTRFEPSVTRALVMAALVLAAFALGRPANAPTVLAPAVLGLLLIDPLLAWSLAFQLSVAATLGLVVLTPAIVEHLPGPDLLRFPIAATLAAQLAVSPLLFSTFGYVSVTAVPANLLAAPAAAGVMMWGLVAGVIAGIGAPTIGWAIHLPTRAMIWWIDGVASLFARVEVGQMTRWHVIFAVTGFVLIRSDRLWRGLAVGCLAGGIVVPIATPATVGVGHHVLIEGVELHRSSTGHDVVVLRGGPRISDVVEALRRANIGRIDIVIAADGGRASGRLVQTLDRRFKIVDVWAPRGHQIPRGRTMEDFDVVVGTLRLHDLDGALVVEEVGLDSS